MKEDDTASTFVEDPEVSRKLLVRCGFTLLVPAPIDHPNCTTARPTKVYASQQWKENILNTHYCVRNNNKQIYFVRKTENFRTSHLKPKIKRFNPIRKRSSAFSHLTNRFIPRSNSKSLSIISNDGAVRKPCLCPSDWDLRFFSSSLADLLEG